MFTSRWIFVGVASVGLASAITLSGWTVVRSGWLGDAPTSAKCSEQPKAKSGGYEPITVGPVALDPGAEASVGTELKWYGQQASLGYVIKLFLHVETGGLNVLRLSAESLDGGQPMLFDYPKGHLEDRGGYRPTVTYDSSDLEQFAKLTRAAAGSAGIPGAAVAPSLGPYRFTVEGSQGKTWTRTITVCHPVVPAISK